MSNVRGLRGSRSSSFAACNMCLSWACFIPCLQFSLADILWFWHFSHLGFSSTTQAAFPHLYSMASHGKDTMIPSFLNSKASTTITPGWLSSLTWTWPFEPRYHQLLITVIFLEKKMPYAIFCKREAWLVGSCPKNIVYSNTGQFSP